MAPGTATDSEPFVCRGRDHALVPDIVSNRPVSRIIHQVRELPIVVNDRVQGSWNIDPSEPAETIGCRGQEGELEGVLLAGTGLEILVKRFCPHFSSINLDAIQFHDAERTGLIARFESEESGVSDIHPSSDNLHSATWKGSGIHAAVLGQIFGLDRCRLVVICRCGVGPLIDGNGEIGEVRPA